MQLSKFIIFKSLIWLGLTLAMSGCASTGLVSYPERLSKTRSDLGAGQFEQAVTEVKAATGGPNASLELAEQGRVAQMAGDYTQSLQHYQVLISTLKTDQLAPQVRISRVLESSGSILVNDNVIPYEVQGYEAVLVYAYQALNYLALNDPQNALVLIRQANEEQTFQSWLHDKQLAEADQKSKEAKWQFKTSDVTAKYAAQMSATAVVKNSFENGFLYYLSALCYQSTGDLNNAIVSFKNALSVAPDNVFLQRGLLALFQQRDGSNSDQLSQYARQFGIEAPQLPDQAGVLAVIYEGDLIPARQEVHVPLPIAGQLQLYSFPSFTPSEVAPPALQVQVGNTASQGLQLLTNLEALQARALIEQYPLIFVRETLRIIAKTAITYAASQKEGNGAGILAQVFSIITSRPDLRSWLTLPDHIQMGQFYLKPGTYPLHLDPGQSPVETQVKIQPGKVTLVWVIGINGHLKIKTIPLGGAS